MTIKTPEKFNTVFILFGVWLMEKALFRLGWVSAESIVPFFAGCMMFVAAKLAAASDMLEMSLNRRTVCVLLTALCFSVFTVLGSVRELYAGSPLRVLFDTAVTFGGLFFMFAVFLTYAYRLLDDTRLKRPAALPFSARRFFIYTLLIMFCYLPLFLRFYPGSFGADSINQIRQAMHLVPYTNHLPVLSTWLIELFYNIGYAVTGDVNLSLAFYTAFQMLITAMTCAACVCYLESRRVPALLKYAVLAVFALLPMLAMYAIYIHKDTPATDLLLLLIIYLHYFTGLESGGDKKVKLRHAILFALLGILFMLFRSNHYYVYIGLFVCAVFALKNLRKILTVVMAAAIIISSLFKGPVLRSIDIHGADAAETLSMPLVMISYTLSVGGDVSEGDRAIIDRVVPCGLLSGSYSETSANPVKRAVRGEGDLEYLTEHKSEFLGVFLRVFFKNPAACLIALTDHSKGYYCPKFTYPELILGTWENEFGAYTDSRLPEGIGQRVYENAQLAYDTYEKYLGCAMSFWLILFLMFFAIYKRRSPLAYLPPVGIVLTFLLASPNVGRFRYQYPVMAAAILLVGLTFCEEKNDN